MMLHPNRRQLLQSAGAGALALAVPGLATAADEKKKASSFTLPKLPYDYDALEPHIDTETMKIHHDKHHQAYVNNLNAALAKTKIEGKSIEAILRDMKIVPATVRQAVINNGGGHANHTLFWEVMGPKAGGKPSGALAKAIDDKFESFDKLQTAMTQAATTRFGSGWAWLVVGKDGKLAVLSTANQDSPLMAGQTPILGLDVWEHAYYLKYRNLRADYVKAWWNVVNWVAVGDKYAAAMKD